MTNKHPDADEARDKDGFVHGARGVYNMCIGKIEPVTKEDFAEGSSAIEAVLRNPMKTYLTDELPKFDSVNHPKHYKSHPSGVECITITEHFNFNVGNAIKYLWRSSHKNGLEDLKKAAWYVQREIDRLEMKE